MRAAALVPEQTVTGRAPHVSVVVPTFNRVGLLRETVESILAQTFRDFELIIVDNMSEDGTEAYVGALDDPRVRYFRNPNGGVIAVNRNLGIQRARGQYVALCDDDDLWLREKLEKQVAVLDKQAHTGICYTNATTFGADGVIDQWMMKRVFNDHYRHLLIGNFIPNSTVLVRKELFERIGLLSEDPRFTAVEDYAMWLKVARDRNLAYLDEPLIKYRLHVAANSGNLAKMAGKTFRVIAAQGSSCSFSPFWMYCLVRAGIRYAVRTLQPK